eukprot:TRINITY_DN13030_c0_g1_i1.p2 TRINITY_DN13030_c0_g1~~TRINITY_DN13030_c0_g1_i1.p2  ORF type:complete len:185 (-),score=48.81 TRINITY_DN13030_c0_g1_i1:25-579(-)
MSQTRTADQQMRYQKRVDELLAMLKEQGEYHKQVDNAAEWAKLKEKHGDALTIKQCYPALGQKVLEEIATNFYDAVYADDANWFADQFRNASPKEEAILNQWTFFVEHMGGPKVFEFWRNPGAETLVRFTHQRFRMTMAGLGRWLDHMQGAVRKTGLNERAPELAQLFINWCMAFGQHMVEHPI